METDGNRHDCKLDDTEAAAATLLFMAMLDDDKDEAGKPEGPALTGGSSLAALLLWAALVIFAFIIAFL